MLLPLRCDSGIARVMSRTPWRAASQFVTGRKNPCARWKEMTYGEVVTSERSFLRLSFLLRRYRGRKRKFLVRPFSLPGFSSIYCYLPFFFIAFETVQIVQLSCILWYKSNTSYAEVQVLTIVKGQANIPSLNYRFLSQALFVIES